ncbi:MAG TPA: polysaccharide deacetylase family protein [Bacteriovoracaceae bacterium]|nr:polysaccharide deacetylase family protein [Bacteriovoracaceae bacterium]
MPKVLITILFSIFLGGVHADAPLPEQYPEDRIYTSSDRGYTQYGAPSLLKSGMYSLTFDDGPDPVKTPALLDVLKKYDVKATFFVITSLITEKSFPVIKRMLDDGHIVASHGLRHDNSNDITAAVWKARVKQSFIDLNKWYKKAGHKFDKHYYRFPYAAYGLRPDHHHFNSLKEISRELMNGNCIQFVFWDHDSGDWIPKMTSQEVAANLKATNVGGTYITYKTIRTPGRAAYQVKIPTTIQATSGGVVLQHDIQANAVLATENFLKYALEENLSIIRLDEVEEFKVTKKCEMP